MTMRAVAWLSALALLLGGFLLYDLTRPTTDQRRTQAARLVPGIDRRTVQRITITRGGTAPFTLVRQPLGREPAWRLDPGGRRADAAAVEDLLTTLDFGEAERTADLTPEAAGLVPPTVVLGLDGHALRLGRADATGRGVFVQLGDAREVRVAPARLRELADRDQTAFRDRRLVALPLEAVTSLTWTAPDGVTRSLAKEADRWKTTGGDSQPVANERVEEALRRVAALRVDLYLEGTVSSPPAAARLQIAGPPGTAALTFGGPGCPSGGLAVARNAPDGTDGACVPLDAVAALWPALVAAAAPDLRLLAQPPASVTRIELADGADQVVLVRERGWRFAAPPVPYEPDPAVIADWLAALHGTQRLPGPPGAKSRRLRVVGRFPESADVAAPKEAYALLDPDPLRFRDRTVLSFAHFDVRRLRHAIPDQAPVEATTRDGDLWLPTTVDRADAARIVTALGDLRAEAFLAKPPRGNPQVTLEVDVQAPGDPKPIRHTVAVFAGCTARLDNKLAFTIAAAPCEDLKLPLAPQRP